ncbi:hypothetical protein ACFQH9_21155 [Pseudonocardia lutea]|jgi:hypothetical protein|uniref:Transmembrane protein n=1 Tax=Pseudonocardia lutea TaxID=2172015 RepID=A0ABW1IAS2_9PSEU
MRVYAERPERVAGQVLADVVAVAWAVVWISLGVAAHDLLLRLQGPGRTLVQAGESIRGAFDGAARGAGEVPFVGDRLAGAFAPGADAGSSLVAAGQQQIDTVAAVATGAGVLVAVLGLLPVLAVWLPLRIRYARRATAAAGAREAGPDVLALRALTHRPLRTLLRITPDPAGAWRTGDPAAVAALAEAELRSLGLRGLREPGSRPVNGR